MRKGYLLVELLTTISLMIVVTLVLNSLFTTLVRDIPRTHRMLEENSYLKNVLEQLQYDINSAGSIYQEQEFLDPNVIYPAPIVLKLADSTVSYFQEEDGVVRQVLEPALPIPTDPNEPDPNQRVWPLNHGRFKWKVWRHDNVGYAVEVQTYMEYSVNGRQKKILENARVYFVGTDPASGVKR